MVLLVSQFRGRSFYRNTVNTPIRRIITILGFELQRKGMTVKFRLAKHVLYKMYTIGQRVGTQFFAFGPGCP